MLRLLSVHCDFRLWFALLECFPSPLNAVILCWSSFQPYRPATLSARRSTGAFLAAHIYFKWFSLGLAAHSLNNSFQLPGKTWLSGSSWLLLNLHRGSASPFVTGFWAALQYLPFAETAAVLFALSNQQKLSSAFLSHRKRCWLSNLYNPDGPSPLQT